MTIKYLLRYIRPLEYLCRRAIPTTVLAFLLMPSSLDADGQMSRGIVSWWSSQVFITSSKLSVIDWHAAWKKLGEILLEVFKEVWIWMHSSHGHLQITQASSTDRARLYNPNYSFIGTLRRFEEWQKDASPRIHNLNVGFPNFTIIYSLI